MVHSPRTRAAVVTALACLLLTSAACGDSDDPDARDDPTPSASASESSADGPSEQPSSTVAPATGPLLEMPGAELHAPEGWTKGDDFTELQTTADNPDYTGFVALGSIELPAAGGELPIEEMESIAVRNSPVQPKPKPLDPVEIGGVEWYHIYSDGGTGRSEDKYGVEHNGYQLTITFSFADAVPEAEQREAVVSVLASFTWR